VLSIFLLKSTISNITFGLGLYIFILTFTPTFASANPINTNENVTDIIQHCYYKNQGSDQRATLKIILKNKEGKVQQGEYLRLWKDYRGDGQLEDKSVLYTLSPIEQAGVNFLRWSYISSAKLPPEQWVYLPELRIVRRVAQRDPRDMAWGLTDDDLRIRDIEEDQHRLISSQQTKQGTIYLVETKPLSAESVYQKWHTRYLKQHDWSDCRPIETVYYSKFSKTKSKTVTFTWLVIDDVWVWDEVKIIDKKTNAEVIYRTIEAKVNTEIKDSQFKERQLKRAPR